MSEIKWATDPVTGPQGRGGAPSGSGVLDTRTRTNGIAAASGVGRIVCPENSKREVVALCDEA